MIEIMVEEEDHQQNGSSMKFNAAAMKCFMTSLTKPADDTIKAVFKGGRGQGINHSNECYNLLMDYDSLEQVINDQAVKTAGAEMCILI